MINAKPSRNAIPKEKSSAITNPAIELDPHTISGINYLPEREKREIYLRLIPPELFDRFNINPETMLASEDDLLHLNCEPGTTTAEMELYHQAGFQDPVLYGAITDTLNGQIHVLLYMLNDPTSPRFDTDRLPDGTPTKFGTQHRNLEAENAAMQYGLTPGQVRRGPRLMGSAIATFERFVAGLGHAMFFADPLHYHNAIIFEQYGFGYEKGKSLMQRIHEGFSDGGDLIPLLDGSTPFRAPAAAKSIRLRSWAVHDGILGEPFDGVTMYKWVGKSSKVQTCPGCEW
jgi:hypothetical protein